MACSKSATLRNAPRRTAFSLNSSNQRSIRLSQLELVGVKCRTNRGCLTKQRFSNALWPSRSAEAIHHSVSCRRNQKTRLRPHSRDCRPWSFQAPFAHPCDHCTGLYTEEFSGALRTFDSPLGRFQNQQKILAPLALEFGFGEESGLAGVAIGGLRGQDGARSGGTCGDRQIKVDRAAAGQDQGALHHVAKLPYIARPMIAFQFSDCSLSQPWFAALQLPG